MNDSSRRLAALRCPCCKGPLSAASAVLTCAACRGSYGWDETLACWDLRPRNGSHSTEADRAAQRVVHGHPPTRRHSRLWRVVRAAHSELPRQRVALRIDVPPEADPDVAEDSFRQELVLVTSATADRRLWSAGSMHPIALVNPSALPIESQAVDLVDADLLDATTSALARRLGEVHRVLAPSGHAYLTGRSNSGGLENADIAARASFGDGYTWIAGPITAPTGSISAAAVYRHLQSWVGFEYTLGRGIQARKGGALRRWLVRLRRQRELVCWRTRPAAADWKSTPSDEPMIFGRFHFPATAPSA